MGNVPKRQQPDHRSDNSRRSPTCLQCNEKFSHPRRPSAGPQTNIYWFSDNEHHTKLQIVHKKLKVK